MTGQWEEEAYAFQNQMRLIEEEGSPSTFPDSDRKPTLRDGD
jgi:hypothetical protein